MVCHQCHGQHWVIRGGLMCPCPECGGLGEIHCCEGLVAQQESPRLVACVETPTRKSLAFLDTTPWVK
jgi:hypothetical protein